MVYYRGPLQGTGGLTVFPRPVPSPCDITCFHVIRWSAANLESFHLKFQFNGICAAEQKIQSAVVWGGMQIQRAELQSCLEKTQDDWTENVWPSNIWYDESDNTCYVTVACVGIKCCWFSLSITPLCIVRVLIWCRKHVWFREAPMQQKSKPVKWTLSYLVTV